MRATRQLHRYPDCRSSGVEWIGDIPSHWQVKRTKFVARQYSGHTPSRQHPEYWANCTIPWFGLADVWQIRDGIREYVTETSEKISSLGLANSAARLLPTGTVILSRTASVGFSGILGVPMATTQDFVNWVCGPRIRPEYLLYVFRAMQQEFRRLTMGSTHQTIYTPDVGRFMTCLPPVDEQDRIVAFVRREMAKIDALVAKKERLIELLNQKRSAVITRAVTTGLTSASMGLADGVEWVGPVPTHWKARRIKWIAAIRYGLGTPPREAPDGLPFIRATNVSHGRICTDDLRLVDPSDVPSSRDAVLKANDIIVVRSGAYTGDSAIIPLAYDGAIVGFDMVVRSRKVAPQFLAWALLSDYVRAAQVDQEKARAAQPHLNAEELGGVVVLVPPPDEQAAAVAFLSDATTRIDVLVDRVQHAIAALRDLRASLIFAAVTGKIDVRDQVSSSSKPLTRTL